MTDAEIRLYRFLVKMKSLTKEEHKNIKGLVYDQKIFRVDSNQSNTEQVYCRTD